MMCLLIRLVVPKAPRWVRDLQQLERSQLMKEAHGETIDEYVASAEAELDSSSSSRRGALMGGRGGRGGPSLIGWLRERKVARSRTSSGGVLQQQQLL
jgi:hypothetical protein